MGSHKKRVNKTNISSKSLKTGKQKKSNDTHEIRSTKCYGVS